MGSTTNFGLTKLESTDKLKNFRSPFNGNMDLVDTALAAHKGTLGKILPVISGSTNDSGYAISAGEYFEAGGKLYKATASIPTGNSWSSSATELSDHGAVNALNSNLETRVKVYRVNRLAIKIYLKSSNYAQLLVTQSHWGTSYNSLTFVKKTSNEHLYKEVLFGKDIYNITGASGYIQLEDRSEYPGGVGYDIIDLANTIDHIDSTTASGSGAPSNSGLTDFLSVPAINSSLEGKASKLFAGQVYGTSTLTINTTSGARIIAYSFSSNAGSVGEWSVMCGSDGTLYIADIKTSANITLSSSQENKVTFTSASASYANIYLLILEGSASVSS